MRPALPTALAALALLSPARPAPAQTVYVVGTNNAFGRVDLATRQYTQIASSLGGGHTYNLTDGGSAGAFYATQNPGGSSDNLVRVLSDGQAFPLGGPAGRATASRGWPGDPTEHCSRTA